MEQKSSSTEIVAIWLVPAGMMLGVFAVMGFTFKALLVLSALSVIQFLGMWTVAMAIIALKGGKQ